MQHIMLDPIKSHLPSELLPAKASCFHHMEEQLQYNPQTLGYRGDLPRTGIICVLLVKLSGGQNIYTRCYVVFLHLSYYWPFNVETYNTISHQSPRNKSPTMGNTSWVETFSTCRICDQFPCVHGTYGCLYIYTLATPQPVQHQGLLNVDSPSY